MKAERYSKKSFDLIKKILSNKDDIFIVSDDWDLLECYEYLQYVNNDKVKLTPATVLRIRYGVLKKFPKLAYKKKSKVEEVNLNNITDAEIEAIIMSYPAPKRTLWSDIKTFFSN